MLILNPQFDPLTHEYKDSDGNTVASVTQIMESVGMTNEFQKDKYAAEWGTIAHEYTEKIVDDKNMRVDPAFAPWHVQIRRFCVDKIPRRKGVGETRFLFDSPAGRYAGCIDFEGRLWHESAAQEWVVDWKFWLAKSKSVLRLAGIQTAAYELATRGKARERKRAVVWFKRDDYEFITLTDKTDYVAWASAINVYTWRKNNL